jgi:hypothetical protein
MNLRLSGRLSIVVNEELRADGSYEAKVRTVGGESEGIIKKQKCEDQKGIIRLFYDPFGYWNLASKQAKKDREEAKE